MSIFIANLAFAGDASLISDSKMAVFIASFAAAVIGLAWLHWACPAPQRA
jgi:NhaA family Na+:H+ antiporter